MKNRVYLLPLVVSISLFAACGAYASNIIRLVAPVSVSNKTWEEAAPIYTDWENLGEIFGCVSWAPDANGIMSNQTLVQQSTDCKINQQRFKQNREQSSVDGKIRNIGDPVRETRLIDASAERDYTVTYTTWSDSGSLYGCSNWSPDSETITWGEAFIQEATDCKQDQKRSRTDSYLDLTGTPISLIRGTESKTLSGLIDTRTETGRKDGWVAANATYTDWVSTNELYSCGVWLPSPASVNSTQTFTQQALDCKTDQQRFRQERERQLSTQDYRDVGEPVVENKTMTGQIASRHYTVTLGSWVDSGAKYACSNWSPAPSTVTVGASFTQTATDCKQDQTRTRTESYVDHKTASTMQVSVPGESRTLTSQSATRSATGSKEDWVEATPSYTAWTDTNSKYGCSVWLPAPSIQTTTGSFTQTASDCKTDQTRQRQDREQETTTLAYRNKGAAVTEHQTLTAQSASRKYTVTLGSWANTSGIYGCSNWNPLTSDVQKNVGFTQTATDCKINQQRSRAENYIDHRTGSTVNVPVSAETIVATTSSSRGAVGIKNVAVCGYDYNGVVANYKFWSENNSIWTGNLIPNVPAMWFAKSNLSHPFSNPVTYQAGVTKISDQDYRYTNGTFTWRIYRGAYMGNGTGHIMYQVCIE